MRLTSPAFGNNGKIPSKYTCQGENINPKLNIEDIPRETQSLVLIMDDPDAPMKTWDHWIVFNISPQTETIDENSEPDGVAGKNSWGKLGYGGPCPPSGKHRYIFRVYALDTILDLNEGVDKKQVLGAVEGHILAKAELIGLYEKT